MARCSSARERGATNRAGCARWEPDQLTHSMPADGTVRVMDIEPERVAELQREGTIQLIDVREDYEWDAGRIPGARHLALGERGRAGRDDPPRDAGGVLLPRGRAVGDGRERVPARGLRRVQHDGRHAGMGGARDCRSSPTDGHVADH